MDTQTFINIAIGLVGALGGWVLNSLRDNIATLQRADSMLSDKLQHVEILVAGSYVRRDDLDKLTIALFTKLDRIEHKVDGKADK